MQLPCSEELNIEYLGRLFDNTSECYKFFWFKAIVAKRICNDMESLSSCLKNREIVKLKKKGCTVLSISGTVHFCK